MLGNQPLRRPLGDDLAGVHHDQSVTQLLGLVHEVRGDHLRRPTFFKLVQPVPEDVASLWVEPCCWFVEQQEIGFVDQRTSNTDPPLLAPRQRIDFTVSLLGELHELQQFVSPCSSSFAREVEVAAVDHEVLKHGEIVVELVQLRHHTHASADLAAVGDRVQTEDAERASRGR